MLTWILDDWPTTQVISDVAAMATAVWNSDRPIHSIPDDQ